MKNDYYVYMYTIDNNPIYIGYGRGNRIIQHLWKSKRSGRKTYFYNKIEKELKAGTNILYNKVSESLTRDDAIKEEIDLIKKYGRLDNGSGILYNLTDGGDGGNGVLWNEERKSMLSIRSKGKKLSEEHIQALIKHNTGRVLSDETKSKISAAQTGISKPKKESSRVNYSNAAKKRSSDKEYIKRLSESRRTLYINFMCIKKDIKTNETIKVYDNVYSAADDVGGIVDRILACASGKRAHHKGFKWEVCDVSK